MSELRRNPVTGHWVIIAGDRGKRPHDFASLEQHRDEEEFSEECPFCPGNESETPPSVLEIPGLTANDPWQIRVFPNKFAALSSDSPPPNFSGSSLFVAMPGQGSHEVIVETPVHNRFPDSRSDAEMALLLQVYQRRYLELQRNPIIRYILIFKNQGEAAGTSLVHPHSQIIAAPVMPEDVNSRGEFARDYYEQAGQCLYCQMAQEEMKLGRRLVYSDEHFVVFHPFAASRPGETWVVPLHHQSSFGLVTGEELAQFAAVLLRTLRQLKNGFGDPDFNYVLHSSPTQIRDEEGRYWHWYLQIIPRLTRTAGLELGSGIYINTLPPEMSAEMMQG